jgi:hypothetical protein
MNTELPKRTKTPASSREKIFLIAFIVRPPKCFEQPESWNTLQYNIVKAHLQDESASDPRPGGTKGKAEEFLKNSPQREICGIIIRLYK